MHTDADKVRNNRRLVILLLLIGLLLVLLVVSWLSFSFAGRVVSTVTGANTTPTRVAFDPGIELLHTPGVVLDFPPIDLGGRYGVPVPSLLEAFGIQSRVEGSSYKNGVEPVVTYIVEGAWSQASHDNSRLSIVLNSRLTCVKAADYPENTVPTIIDTGYRPYDTYTDTYASGVCTAQLAPIDLVHEGATPAKLPHEYVLGIGQRLTIAIHANSASSITGLVGGESVSATYEVGRDLKLYRIDMYGKN
jgi:hypothetical protein